MSRKKNTHQKPNKAEFLESTRAPALFGFGKKLMGGGIGIIVFGFWVLSFADSLGVNLASSVSPFLILGGYALIALGILWPPPTNYSSSR